MLQNLEKLLAQYKLNIYVIALVALSSMVFIYPFDSHFRFALSSVMLSMLLLYFRQLPTTSTIIFSGMAILILRSCITIALSLDSNWGVALMNNLPALIYYTAFAMTWHDFNIRGSIDNMPLLILKLSLADIISNIVEIASRPDLLENAYETILLGVIAIGIVRAILSLFGYYILKKYHSFVLAGTQVERYTELALIIARLKADLIYLRKSSQDIEQVMEQSYWLYNHLQTKEHDVRSAETHYASQALAIARNIHEVKKDYRRVIASIENKLKPSAVERGMALREILFIIEQNTLRLLTGEKRAVQISFKCHDDIDAITDKHYVLISMLDNIIINAIEACGTHGKILVSQAYRDGCIVFTIEDDGCGISDNDYEIIFKPGYSTKFSPETGKMSTGLGLAYAQNLAEQLGANIKVVSQPGSTCFSIYIPYHNIAI